MNKTSKRILSLYMLFTACFMAILVRIVYINFSMYADASENQSTRTVIVGTSRGKIYDRASQLLVDEKSRLVAAVTPVEGAKKYISSFFSQETLQGKIESGYPFVTTVSKEINNELIKTFSVPVRYSSDSLACHIIGYTDYSSRGITGVERAFEKELSAYNGKLSVSFEVDALGRVLAGMDKTISDENFNSKGGVVLTLDKDIQAIAEKAIKNSGIVSGCAIVTDATSGEVLALVSAPDFDRNKVENYLDEENSPLVNKALESYSAGSVFKSIVAAFALEKGVDESFCFNCEGTLKIGDKEFSCPSEEGHGKLTMSEALQQSCNLYFVNLIDEIDCEAFLDFCKELGFSRCITLCSGIEAEEGLLPDLISLSMEGNKANFSFGQGDLLVTPLQIAKAYGTLATGEVKELSLLYGFCDAKGSVTRENKPKSRRLLSEETTEKIRDMLLSVTEKGIATNAKSESVKIAGKTGTAESGIFDESGEELLRTWYAGFYPAEEPRYVVVVMNENGISGNTDCAPVVREICEGIEIQ